VYKPYQVDCRCDEKRTRERKECSSPFQEIIAAFEHTLGCLIDAFRTPQAVHMSPLASGREEEKSATRRAVPSPFAEDTAGDLSPFPRQLLRLIGDTFLFLFSIGQDRRCWLWAFLFQLNICVNEDGNGLWHGLHRKETALHPTVVFEG
jgi:hypothetical protein